jgi:hypothetical protein
MLPWPTTSYKTASAWTTSTSQSGKTERNPYVVRNANAMGISLETVQTNQTHAAPVGSNTAPARAMHIELPIASTAAILIIPAGVESVQNSYEGVGS